MGIQDRDYYHERTRERERGSRPSSLRASVRRLGIPAWAVWIALILVGLVAAKWALDLRRSAVPFPKSGHAHWYVGDHGERLATLTIEAPRTPNAQFAVRLDQWKNQMPVVLIPVRGGETAQVKVPLGVYSVVFVKGWIWSGPEKLWAPA